jgi:hypothetical protein
MNSIPPAESSASTSGNPTPEEAELLDSILFDLRLRHLKVSGASQAVGTEPAAPPEEPPKGRIIIP